MTAPDGLGGDAVWSVGSHGDGPLERQPWRVRPIRAAGEATGLPDGPPDRLAEQSGAEGAVARWGDSGLRAAGACRHGPFPSRGGLGRSADCDHRFIHEARLEAGRTRLPYSRREVCESLSLSAIVVHVESPTKWFLSF